MELKAIHDARLSETVYEGVHASGLRVLICHKPAFSSTYAMFGTVYGSIDNRFRRGGEPEMTEVPEGIAHFLEHKLFENEDGDVFSLFSKTGASANAYTSFDRTCYLFSCTDQFDASFETLLDFVQSPYFTPATVQKEQGIIGQEIDMYRDSAEWRVFFNLLTALYHQHPVHIDIAGTKESISQITDQLLYQCYHTFYHPGNMFICVAGNAEPEHVAALIDRHLRPSVPQTVERGVSAEPETVRQPLIEQALPVSMPMFCLGFKEPCPEPHKPLRHRAAMKMLMELLVGPTSDLYCSMLEDGLINDHFGAEYFTGFGYASLVFSGESTDPSAVCERIADALRAAKTAGFAPEAFETAKKALYGRLVSLYNNPDYIASQLVECLVSDEAPFEAANLYAALTEQDLSEALAAIDPQNRAVSIVRPTE